MIKYIKYSYYKTAAMSYVDTGNSLVVLPSYNTKWTLNFEVVAYTLMSVVHTIKHTWKPYIVDCTIVEWATYPNMTAFQSIILFSVGAPLTPAGGSSCNLLRSWKLSIKI